MKFIGLSTVNSGVKLYSSVLACVKDVRFVIRVSVLGKSDISPDPTVYVLFRIPKCAFSCNERHNTTDNNV